MCVFVVIAIHRMLLECTTKATTKVDVEARIYPLLALLLSVRLGGPRRCSLWSCHSLPGFLKMMVLIFVNERGSHHSSSDAIDQPISGSGV